MESMTRLFNPPLDRSLPLIIGTTALTTLAIYKLVDTALRGTGPKIIKSPSATLLPSLTTEEIADLPYPPDTLPGGRDVDSPYGTTRIYEWGPEDGRKVLLVHGISTPCIALGALAHALVGKGCRVMTFDLWGRGYSDSCADLQHDDRLYSTQILLALTSSKLSWTGSGSEGGFSLIGYSLGGGISAAFTAYFPGLVNSLVLLAPAGLIRPVHMGGRSKFLYSTGFLPEIVLQWAVRRRLRTPMYANENKKTDVRDAVSAETEVKGGAEFAHQDAPLCPDRPGITVVKAVQWQLREHAGFVHSFMSSIRFAPITGQHSTWRELALFPSKILVFAGSTDPIIYVEELKEDMVELLGEEKVDYRVIEGAHDFPITEAVQVVEGIWKFWNESAA